MFFTGGTGLLLPGLSFSAGLSGQIAAGAAIGCATGVGTKAVNDMLKGSGLGL